MKKLLFFFGFGVLGWTLLSHLFLQDVAVTVTDRAKSVPAQVNLDTMSKLVVMDSLEKTGRMDRYTYSWADLQTLFQKNKFRILENNFDYFYCYEGNHVRYPQANMLFVAAEKKGDLVLAKGSSFFTDFLPQMRKIPEKSRTSMSLENALKIDSAWGQCIKIP